jgi:hypothetical protein
MANQLSQPGVFSSSFTEGKIGQLDIADVDGVGD